MRAQNPGRARKRPNILFLRPCLKIQENLGKSGQNPERSGKIRTGPKGINPKRQSLARGVCLIHLVPFDRTLARSIAWRASPCPDDGAKYLGTHTMRCHSRLRNFRCSPAGGAASYPAPSTGLDRKVYYHSRRIFHLWLTENMFFVDRWCRKHSIVPFCATGPNTPHCNTFNAINMARRLCVLSTLTSGSPLNAVKSILPSHTFHISHRTPEGPH